MTDHDVTRRRHAIHRWLELQARPHSVAEVRDHLNIDKHIVEGDLKALEKEKRVKSSGKSPKKYEVVR